MSNKYDRHYPAIPLRNVTVFPGMVMHFDVSRKKSVKAVEASSLGISIYRHDPKGKVAQAYAQVTEEVLYREN